MAAGFGGGIRTMTLEMSEDSEVDRSILPVGYLGVVAPMSTLGFALHPFFGIVYDEAIALIPAHALVFSFQRRRAADEARGLAYDAAATREGVRILRLRDIDRIELLRPVLGYRLHVTIDGRAERWILQHADPAEVTSILGWALGGRFVDGAARAAA